jgi:hypothetical protein
LVPAFKASRKKSGDKETFLNKKIINESKAFKYLRETLEIFGAQLRNL